MTDGVEPDYEALAEAAERARILVLNTPMNPTGKVFTREELERIEEIVFEHDLIVLTDEIYEHIVYTDDYVSPVEVGDLAERTVVCTGMSKTFSVTGWRIGFCLAPEYLSGNSGRSTITRASARRRRSSALASRRCRSPTRTTRSFRSRTNGVAISSVRVSVRPVSSPSNPTAPTT